ncbi:diaminopimelate epimerase [Leptolyngbya sp. Heron Island J]|nr:diaminopimelate epimerase [Leptolyngbya sp. Heron Island J]
MDISFIKCHGSGNDFVLIDELDNGLNLDSQMRHTLTKLLTNRNSVVGSDGVLFMTDSQLGDIRMHVFNPDGNETPMCVNGIRCLGRYAIEKYSSSKKVKVETEVGIIEVEKVEDIWSKIPSYKVEPIKPLTFDEKLVEHNGLMFSYIEAHTPHLITCVEQIDEQNLNLIGQKLNEQKSLYSTGVNVTFIKVLDSNKCFARTFERGGIGLSSLSCSAAMLAGVYHLTCSSTMSCNEWIEVYNKGGMILCKVNKSDSGVDVGSVIGNATFVYDASVKISDNALSNFLQGSANLDEIFSYSSFQGKTQETANTSSFLIELPDSSNS